MNNCPIFATRNDINVETTFLSQLKSFNIGYAEDIINFLILYLVIMILQSEIRPTYHHRSLNLSYFHIRISISTMNVTLPPLLNCMLQFYQLQSAACRRDCSSTYQEVTEFQVPLLLAVTACQRGPWQLKINTCIYSHKVLHKLV